MTASRLEQVTCHNNTRALLEEVSRDISVGFTNWSDFTSVDQVAAGYVFSFRESPLTREELGSRGVQVVEAAIRGEDWETLCDEWAADNYREGAAAKRAEGNERVAAMLDEKASRIDANLRAKKSI